MPTQAIACAHLDERLDLAPPLNLLLTHTACHFSGVAFDSSDDGVGVRSFFCAIIELLDDDDFVAGLTTLEDDSDLKKDSSGRFDRIKHNASVPCQACRLEICQFIASA